MRPLPILAVGFVLATLPVDTTRSVLASAASMVLESAPFVLAGTTLLAFSFRQCARAVPYLGCGCGAGPSARSLPAAVATALAFGPLVAIARLAAGITIAWFLAPRDHACEAEIPAPLEQLASIVPAALAAAAVTLVAAGRVASWHLPYPAAFAAGALAGIAGAPCALGAVGFAAMLRASAPACAIGFLCTAGIVDVHALAQHRVHHGAHDGLAYAVASFGCAFVASHNGDALVHPRFTFALWLCAIVFAALAWRHRKARAPRAYLAPVVMAIGAVLGAPLPSYHATETTLTDAFAGERIDFTGVLTRTGASTALVRYAITCCRADAAPIVLQLEHAPARLHGWIHASGTLAGTNGELRLRATLYEPVAAPGDPFLYR
ncbi:MAG: TIGR03943 family putative permease subunit [Vulcanimicrobiaceae bacterium]